MIISASYTSLLLVQYLDLLILLNQVRVVNLAAILISVILYVIPNIFLQGKLGIPNLFVLDLSILVSVSLSVVPVWAVSIISLKYFPTEEQLVMRKARLKLSVLE